jgi:hypothetical protein
MGHHFGVPFHAVLQRKIVLQALHLIEAAERSGTIKTLPIKWADVRRQAKTLTDQGRQL